MANKKRLSRKFINGLNRIQIEYLHELITGMEVPKTSYGATCSVCEGTKTELEDLIEDEMTRQGWNSISKKARGIKSRVLKEGEKNGQ